MRDHYLEAAGGVLDGVFRVGRGVFHLHDASHQLYLFPVGMKLIDLSGLYFDDCCRLPVR